MSGRIVVGIDGSQSSANALEWGIERAQISGEQLDLVNVYSLTPALDFYGYHAASQPLDWVVESSSEVAQAAEARVRAVAPALPCTATTILGHPAHVLAAASEGADVLVVGRRGNGAVASTLLGSVSNRLTTASRCPLVVMGDEAIPGTGPVVVGVDGSDFAVNALRFAYGEAKLRQAALRVVSAFDFLHPSFRLGTGPSKQMRSAAKADAAGAVERALRAIGVAGAPTVQIEEVVVEGRAAEVIVEHSGDAQLVVVGTHGKGLIRRVLLGSVSRQVLNDCDRPVAVVDHLQPDD
jgi:nucleotide-binding universal stress UspA family protein